MKHVAAIFTVLIVTACSQAPTPVHAGSWVCTLAGAGQASVCWKK